MMATPKKVGTDQIVFDPNQYGIAYVKSQSDDSRAYIVNYVSRECDCNDYKYRRKDKKENCKHLDWVLRLMSIMKMEIPPDPRFIN